MAELTREQLENEVKRRLQDPLRGVDAGRLQAIVEACANDLRADLEDEKRWRRVDRDLTRRDRYYAVPDEELDLLPSLVSAAIEAFTGAPSKALPGLFAVLWRYRKHRVALDGDEALVLRALKDADDIDAGGLTANQLRERLGDGSEMTTKEIEKVLAQLFAKSEKAGEAVRLVETENGRWWIGNV